MQSTQPDSLLTPRPAGATQTIYPAPVTTLKPTIPAVTQLPPIGQRIAFEAEDGTPLMGEYFPASVDPAPAIILMHQMGGNRRAWVRKGVVAWLNNSPDQLILPTSDTAKSLEWPPLPEEVSFAVFAFDFRGHGESQGGQGEMSDFLQDARAAVAVVRGLPGVDAQRVALVGTSIGADAAVDTCGEGCLGALSLSPGGYLGEPYVQAVARMAAGGRKAWCLAASGDTRSAEACAAAEGEDYYSLVYAGRREHGEDLITSGLDPDITMILRNFLFQVFGL